MLLCLKYPYYNHIIASNKVSEKTKKKPLHLLCIIGYTKEAVCMKSHVVYQFVHNFKKKSLVIALGSYHELFVNF